MQITLPKKPRLVRKENFNAVIEVENLYPGYGMTLGNALRRVLLSSLEGAAVTLVKIKGVSHEFSTVPSVMEDVVQILLNVKKLRFKMHSDELQKAYIKVTGQKEVTGKDIEAPSQVEVINTGAHIATLTDKKATFEMEIHIEKGFGYVPVEGRAKEKLEIGAVALDAIFTPIRKINYEVENMRVGERTDFDRLRMIIETDGTIDPEEAFLKASEVLVGQFQELASLGEEHHPVVEAEKEVVSESDKTGETSELSTLNIPVRVLHALEAGGIRTIDELASKAESEILKLEGMGAKGVSDIKKVLKKLGVSFRQES